MLEIRRFQIATLIRNYMEKFPEDLFFYLNGKLQMLNQ